MSNARTDREVPKPAFCPYCGSEHLAFRMNVPRCLSCRAVFILMFCRYTRKSRKA
jgi:hypothetical protein